MGREQSMTATRYLNGQEIKVAATSLDLISTITGFDIVELWISEKKSAIVEEHDSTTYDGDEGLHLVHVQVTDELISRHPGIITGAHPNRDERVHALSPELCRMLMRSKDRNFYWRTADSKTNGATSLLYGQNQLPFKTEMAFRMVGSNYGVTLIIVGFSFQILQRKKSHFKCLAGIVYALYSSAFDNEDEHAINDTQNDEPGLPTQRQSELDLKTYNLSDNKGSTPETENPQSAQQCLHSDLAQGMMIWNRSLAEMKEKTHSGEQLPVKVSSTDDDAVGLCIDECDGDTRKVPVKDAQQHAVAGSTNTHATAPVDGSSFDSYSAPPVLAEIEEVAKEAEKHAERHSQYQVPSWQPHSPFSYPVASIPIRQTVNCNLIFPDNFSDVTHLADGSNSNIFSCILRGESVIVKMIKVQAEKDRTAVHEYDIEFGLLARIDHPNIIRVLGAGMLPRRFLVLEQLGGGTLTQIMAQRQKSTFTSMIFRKPTFTYEELLLRARDLAAALDYLHFKCHSGASILHRDLKPDNVGFTKDGCLKLFDLGLATLVNARTHSSQRYKMSGYTGSLRYMAPEVALRKRYGEKVDVYSYGILLWQMARDRTPFNSITTVEEFMEGVVHRGLRPKLDKVWPSEFSSLLCSCWHKEAELRPSFAQIVAELNTFLQNYSIGRSGTKMSAASAADGVSRSGNTSTADSSVNANNGVAPLPPAPPTARRGKKISKGNAEPETQSTWF